eukprot:scaffold455_cov116-Isochrysis_galbana.AAC.10
MIRPPRTTRPRTLTLGSGQPPARRNEAASNTASNPPLPPPERHTPHTPCRAHPPHPASRALRTPAGTPCCNPVHSLHAIKKKTCKTLKCPACPVH